MTPARERKWHVTVTWAVALAGESCRRRAKVTNGTTRWERSKRHRWDRAGIRKHTFMSRRVTHLYYLKNTGRIRTNESEGERVPSERWKFLKWKMELSPFNEKSWICPSHNQGQRMLYFGRNHHLARRVHSGGNHAALRFSPGLTLPCLGWTSRVRSSSPGCPGNVTTDVTDVSTIISHLDFWLGSKMCKNVWNHIWRGKGTLFSPHHQRDLWSLNCFPLPYLKIAHSQNWTRCRSNALQNGGFWDQMSGTGCAVSTSGAECISNFKETIAISK